MPAIPTNRTTANTAEEHVADHNELHRLHNLLDGHLDDPIDAHDASAISFVPTPTIAATNVQAAIEEVAAEGGGGSGGTAAHGPSLHTGTSDMHALTMGRAGAIPAATTLELADFLIVVPFNMTLQSIRATAGTAPTSSSTFQMRRSTDSGASWSNFFGSIELPASSRSATTDPTDLDVNAGEMLNFSVTVGGGSGANILILLIGKAR